ncbi:hypothetical protein DRE_06606 [Drechslerella stenobrocha 248]|uniref:Uncharacterized protein n=1 Tax=Drechslerella stenobrocha 248 TaxID=1043628 RepID=W7HWZ7_9PEZI|nr:hypothetical protein DRE_06606 [Drechslerella stenobrocha 248]
MPIKLPRFRRKSVGNSLDTTYQAAEPESPGAHRGAQFSFDEIERPSQTQSTYSQYPQQQYRQEGYSSHLKYGDSTGSSSASRSNSNSGGSTGTGYYASDRQSSSSTLPSSTDIPRTPPSTEDHYRPGFADSMSLKEPMAYGAPVTVPKTGWHNSKSGPISKGAAGMGGRQIIEPPRLETSLDSEPLFGEDMFKFTSDGKRMSTIGISDAVGPKVATSLFVPNKNAHIEPVPPVPPPKSVNSNAARSGAGAGRWLDLKIHGDDEDAYPATPATSRYQGQGPTSLPSPSVGKTRPSPSARDGMYPWEARQDTEEDSLMSREKSPSPGPPAPPKKDLNQPRHNRTLTPSTSTTQPQKVDAADSLATPPQTGRAPRPPSSDLALKRGMVKGGKGPRSRSPVSRITRKEVPLYQTRESHVGEDDDSVHSLSTVPTTKVTITSPPTISRVQTSPAIIQQDNLFSDVGSRSSISGGRPSMPARAGSEDMLTSALARDAAIASSFEAGESNRLKQPRKVFTKAQFERYKAQQEEERQYQAKNGEKDESDSETELSDDDQDELEKQRALAKQRARQDAHLAVYRQQMMKITGSHGNDTTNLGMTNRGASSSTPMLSVTNLMPHLSVSSPSSLGDKSDNEDEEVPLGILMAHGFPSKQTGRPPTRLSNSNSSPNLRSISGTTQFDGNGGAPSLPPFARHLPADPYFGASIVNQSNRMSMAPSSIYGGSQRDSQFVPPPQQRAPPQRYPTGLIGNIVRDEELRAARKGGAQHAPFYNEAQLSSGPMSPPVQSASETVSLQMASQMTQMMQLQMQWMQQMSQMNQSQQQQHLAAMQTMMPGMMPGMNPMAMMSANNLSPSMLMPGQRAMSMVDTGSVPQIPLGPGMMGPQQPGASLSPGYAGSVYGHNRSSTLPTFMQPGYTPSIAPSERSNIGQPSRYRPVTYQAGSGGSSIGGGRSNTLTSGVPGGGLKVSLAKDDSDDEDGWAEMGKKKKEKQETWRRKKDTGLRTVLKLGGN